MPDVSEWEEWAWARDADGYQMGQIVPILVSLQQNQAGRANCRLPDPTVAHEGGRGRHAERGKRV